MILSKTDVQGCRCPVHALGGREAQKSRDRPEYAAPGNYKKEEVTVGKKKKHRDRKAYRWALAHGRWFLGIACGHLIAVLPGFFNFLLRIRAHGCLLKR